MLKNAVSIALLVLLVISVFSAAFQIKPARAATITVPDDFPTIQQAIDASNEGDAVFVKPGIYYEHVFLNKNISLIGSGWLTTIIDGGGEPFKVVQISSYISASISGFTIRNTSYWGLDFGYDYLYGCPPGRRVIVTENAFIRCYFGIWPNESQCFTIYHNSFINNTYNAYCESPFSPVPLKMIWNNSCEGNYWGSFYNGTDMDKDGVGDTPYLSSAHDFYPLMSPYIQGDINHNSIVDILDGILLARAYASSPPKANWNPHCDLDENSEVDIYDALLLAEHFHEHYP